MEATKGFEYFVGAQRTPEWFKLRLGKVTASRLCDWLAVSKSKAAAGTPLKPRLDYEKELMFERQFGVSFDNYVTSAMQDGIDFEDFARRQYEKVTGRHIEPCGAWYSGIFMASPDGTIGADGLAEIKVVRDTTFTEILATGVVDKHWKQIQGQLWASGREWCDYIVINLNTRKIKIIRVERDEEFIQWIELTLTEKFVVAELDTNDVFDFVDAIPEGMVEAAEKSLTGGW